MQPTLRQRAGHCRQEKTQINRCEADGSGHGSGPATFWLGNMRCGLQHQRLQKESLLGVTSRSTREEKEGHIIAADVSIESGAMTRGAAAIRPLAVIGRRRTSASRLAP